MVCGGAVRGWNGLGVALGDGVFWNVFVLPDAGGALVPEFCQAVRFFGLQGHASELARKCWRPLAWFARRTARGFRAVCGRRGPGGKAAGGVVRGARKVGTAVLLPRRLPGAGLRSACPGRETGPSGSFGRRTRGFCRRRSRKGAGTQKVCTFLQRKSGFLLNFFAKSDTIILYSFKARDFTESSAFRI